MKRGVIKQNNNIVFNHTLSEYVKKYGKRSYCLLKFTKKEVEHFEKYHPNARKGELLEGKRWWLIGDTYYEIPHAISLKGKRVNGKVAISVLAGCCVAAAIAVPTTLAIINRKPVTPEPVPPGPGPTPTTKELELTRTNITLDKGEQTKIGANIKTSSNEKINWEIEGGAGIITLEKTQTDPGEKINVIGNSKGNVTLKATYGDLKAVTCPIEVKEVDTEVKLSLSESEVKIKTDDDPTGTITAIVKPTNTEIKWSSTKTDIVSVLETETSGNVCKFKGLKAGEAFIKATAGNVTKQCKVTVTVPATQFSVSFNSNVTDATPSLPESLLVESGSKIEKPDDPTCDGYIFTGWFNGDNPFDFDTQISSNITLTAKFTKIEDVPTSEYCTVTFDPDNGGEQWSVQCLKNYPIDKPEDNTFEGHNFEGWYNGTAENPWNFGTDLVTENITLTAHWSEIETGKCFKVTFIDEDESSPFAVFNDVDGNGSNTPQPTDLTTLSKPDAFIGWYTDKTEGEEYDFNKAPTKDTTLYARYKDEETIVDKFNIVGNHNLDCDLLTLAAFSTEKDITNKNDNIKWEILDKYSSLITIDETTGVPTISSSGKAKGGKAIIKATKTPEKGETIEKEFEVEIGSFGKLDETYLAQGIAKAKDTSITNNVIIPSRYWDGNKWVAINKIAENGFKGCNGISVYIPVPTIEIGQNAFINVGDLDLEFGDKTNTWYFDGVEFNPTDEGLEKIKEALQAGTKSEKVPTLDGLEFIEITKEHSNEVIGYSVKASKEFKNQDLLIPEWYYETIEEGVKKGHTVKEEGKSLPVLSTYFPEQATETTPGAFEGLKCIKSVTFQSHLRTIEARSFKDCTSLEEIYFSPNFDFIPMVEEEKPIYDIGQYAFDGCSSLKQIEFPSYSSSMAVGDEAFARSGLIKLHIPKELGKTGRGVFKECEQLSTVTFDKNCSLPVICESMFNGCKSLETITLPLFINYIEKSSFLNSGLKEISFENTSAIFTTTESEEPKVILEAKNNTIKEDNAKALLKYQKDYTQGDLILKDESIEPSPGESEYQDSDFIYEPIKEGEETVAFKIIKYNIKRSSRTDLIIPSVFKEKPVIGIDSDTFDIGSGWGKKKIVSLKIPSTIQYVGDGLLKPISKWLTKVEISQNSEITEIPEGFASGCGALTYFNIPDSVTKIGKNAFSGTNSNIVIDVGTKNSKWKQLDRNGNETTGKSVDLFSSFESSSYAKSNRDLLAKLINEDISDAKQKKVISYIPAFKKII